MLPIKFPILLIAAMVAMPAPATAFDEQDFLRQSKTCEAMTRLPWGDVDHHTWSDCMEHRFVRSPEQRRTDKPAPRTPWSIAYAKSLLDATDDGCAMSSSKQPSDPPHMRRPNVWSQNHAWNICMERQGIFVSPTQQQRSLPDFRAMAAEQRTVTITDQNYVVYYGCYTQDRHDQLGDAKIVDRPGPLFPSIEDMKKRTRELVAAASNECRLWNVRDRVQVKGATEDLLCLAPVGSTGRCYWTEKGAINAWE